MIKQVTIDQRFCDICGGDDAYPWTVCLGCGKDLCSMGAQPPSPHVVRYSHAVSFRGSGDGYYCVPCDIQLSEDKSDPLHQAYVAVRDLRDERERYYETQKKLEASADQHVMSMRAARGLK